MLFSFFQKNAAINKIKGGFVLKAVFSKTTYVCTCVRLPNFKFLSFKQEVVLPHPLTTKRIPYKAHPD